MKRLASIDIFRGLTIFLMILVNTQSGGGFNCLIHKSGYGWTLADLVYPSFIFIMGASVYLSSRKYTSGPKDLIIKHILRRTLLIFLMGLLFNWIPFTDNLSDLRVMGVLQRIALIYLGCSLLTLKVKTSSTLLAISGGILLAYGLVTSIYSYDLVDQFDLLMIGTKNMYTPTHDPEGLLSSLPALVNALLGFVAAKNLSEDESEKRITKLTTLSVSLIIAAQVLHLTVVPISKTYWSPSFVLLTSGVAMASWLVFHLICDINGKTKWGIVFTIFGTNSIFCYLLSEVLAVYFWKWGLANTIVDFYKSYLNSEMTSLCWGLTILLLCLIAVYPLYRKKIFLKL